MNNNKPSLDHLLCRAATILNMNPALITDTHNNGSRVTEARYMVFEIMERSGYTHQQIADYFKMNRENVTKGLAKLDAWKGIYKQTKDDCGRLEALILKAA